MFFINLSQQKFERYAETGESFDLLKEMSLCTLDILLQCIFSMETDCQQRFVTNKLHLFIPMDDFLYLKTLIVFKSYTYPFIHACTWDHIGSPMVWIWFLSNEFCISIPEPWQTMGDSFCHILHRHFHHYINFMYSLKCISSICHFHSIMLWSIVTPL